MDLTKFNTEKGDAVLAVVRPVNTAAMESF